MKLKSLLLIICCFGLTKLLFSQEYAVDKGATFFVGMGSFSSEGGELFEDNDNNRAGTLTIGTSINHFVGKNFFIGGGLELSNQSQGDESYNGIGIGPQIGYAFGNSGSTAFPFLDAGVRYYSMSYDYGSYGDANASGTDIFLGLGVIVPLKSHVGLAFEAGYHMIDLKDKDSEITDSGNVFSITVGIVGLLFKSGQ